MCAGREGRGEGGCCRLARHQSVSYLITRSCGYELVLPDMVKRKIKKKSRCDANCDVNLKNFHTPGEPHATRQVWRPATRQVLFAPGLFGLATSLELFVWREPRAARRVWPAKVTTATTRHTPGPLRAVALRGPAGVASQLRRLVGRVGEPARRRPALSGGGGRVGFEDSVSKCDSVK